MVRTLITISFFLGLFLRIFPIDLFIGGDNFYSYAQVDREKFIFELLIENNKSKLLSKMRVYAYDIDDARSQTELNGWSIIDIKPYKEQDKIDFKTDGRKEINLNNNPIDDKTPKNVIIDSPLIKKGDPIQTIIDSKTKQNHNNNINNNSNNNIDNNDINNNIDGSSNSNAPRSDFMIDNFSIDNDSAYEAYLARQKLKDKLIDNRSLNDANDVKNFDDRLFKSKKRSSEVMKEDSRSVGRDNKTTRSIAREKQSKDNVVDYAENDLLPGSDKLELISTIYFNLGEVNPINEVVGKSLATLDRDRQYMIMGHADEVNVSPNAEYSSNFDLSYKRANKIKSQLTAIGISAENMKTLGLGTRYLIVKDAKDGHKLNRRVEIYGFR